MDSIEQRIRAHYAKMGVDLATKTGFTIQWEANSQYGYCLEHGFATREDAERFAISYYRERMQLIEN